MLVEREAQLERLHRAATDTGGRLVLVTGEAGSGKSSLLRALVDHVQGRDVWFGACDNLSTPRPLGPVWDWGHQGASRLLTLLSEQGAPATESVREEAVALLHRNSPLVVVEDVHWADDATVDLLLILGRRVRETSACLVVSYRPDDVVAGSPLALALGDLVGARPVRVQVPPLTIGGVARLIASAGADAMPAELLARTGGNPFFVTECLAHGSAAVPTTVRDAVLARLHRLPAPAVRAAEVFAVHPAGAGLGLVSAMQVDDGGLEACLADGLLQHRDGWVTFRHELGRLAVHDSIPVARRRELHRAALHLVEHQVPVDAALAVHHASEAGDLVAVARHATVAAAHAEQAGARREAIAHLQVALRGEHGPDTSRDLLVRLARLQDETGDFAAAVATYDAVAASSPCPDEALWWRLQACNPLTMSGRTVEASDRVESALAQLDDRVDGRAAALAWSLRCSLAMLERRLHDAEAWARPTLARALACGEPELAAFTEIQTGTALFMTGDAHGYDRVHDGIARARSLGLDRLVLQGLTQIGSGAGEIHDHTRAIPALHEAVRLADRHQLHGRGLYARAWLGRCQLLVGEWDEATVTLSGVLGSARATGITRLTALTALGRLRARRGDPEPWSLLDEALELAEATGHLQRLWPVVAARAEAGWLGEGLADHVHLLERTLALARTLDQPWATGELVWWLHRAGLPADPRDLSRSAPPYVLALRGAWREAAAVWLDRSCRYDAADVLAESQDDQDQRDALAWWTALGASSAAARLSRARRRSGRPVPRGPNAATAANEAGLTPREMDVLTLLSLGLSNSQIAEREHLSIKTVGHHVSHILAKLHAGNRTEAARLATGMGLLAQPGADPHTQVEQAQI